MTDQTLEERLERILKRFALPNIFSLSDDNELVNVAITETFNTDPQFRDAKQSLLALIRDELERQQKESRLLGALREHEYLQQDHRLLSAQSRSERVQMLEEQYNRIKAEVEGKGE